MNYWSHIAIACVFYMLQVAHSVGTTHTSKACYGAPGQSCTEHKISCNNTKKIDIHDAYYTNNTECGQGLSDCNTVTPDNVTESGKHCFNITEMSSLNRNCSTSCTYRAPRRNEYLAFSVVRYECSEESTTSSTSTSTVKESGQKTTEINTGAIVGGGVVVTILALTAITLILVWNFRKLRRKADQREKTNTSSKTDITYSLAGNISQSHYQEIDELKTKSRSSDYDYATVDCMAAPANMNAHFTIEPVTTPHAKQNSGPSNTEDDYDHIGDKPSALTSNYDTTASVAQSAGTAAQTREDNYGYNLLKKETNTKTVQNDYDTTSSANKAVAKLGRVEEKTAEDDYDHFPVTNTSSETLSSYTGKVRDRSDDYAFAGPLQ